MLMLVERERELAAFTVELTQEQRERTERKRTKDIVERKGANGHRPARYAFLPQIPAMTRYGLGWHDGQAYIVRWCSPSGNATIAAPHRGHPRPTRP